MVRVTDIQGGYLELSGTFKVSEDTYEEFSKKHKPKHGDLVFSRVGTYGSVSFVKNSTPFCLGQNTVFIVPKINPYFLFYFLNSPYAHHQINCFATGSTQKTISLASIKSIEVFTPPTRRTGKYCKHFILPRSQDLQPPPTKRNPRANRPNPIQTLVCRFRVSQ